MLHILATQEEMLPALRADAVSVCLQGSARWENPAFPCQKVDVFRPESGQRNNFWSVWKKQVKRMESAEVLTPPWYLIFTSLLL